MISGQDRVLFAAHSAQPGGAEYCLDILLKGIDRSIWDAEVVFACEGPLVDTPRSLGIQANILPMSWWMGYEPSFWYWRNLVRWPWRVARLARKLRKQKFDLVYTNTAVIFEAALAARVAGVPHIWHVHEMLTPIYWRSLVPLYVIRRCISRWARAIVFESRGALRVFEEDFEQYPAKITGKRTCEVYVVPNPLRIVPPSVTRRDRCRAREALGISGGEFLILWIGQFIPRKNPKLMLSAYRKSQMPGRSILIMLGDGPLRTELIHEVKTFDQKNKRVILDGFKTNIEQYLQAADVLVLTSSEESFGLVLLEAAGFSLPVIATDSGGPRDIVDHGKTGFLVEPEDDFAIAHNLAALATNGEMRERMGQAARDRVLNEFTAQRYVAEIQEIMIRTMRRERQCRNRL